MTMQEWKAKINGMFRPKSAAERQKMMKYLVVFPAAVVSAVVILWLLYDSLKKEDATVGGVFNTEMPAGESEGIKSKAEEYAISDAREEKEKQSATVDTLVSLTDTPVIVPDESPTAIEQSAQQYQEIQASLQDFYVPEPSVQSADIAALEEKIAELEAQAATAQNAPTEMELMQESYRMASQLMGNGQVAPPAAPESKEKRNILPVQNVAHNVVSTLSAQTNERGFNTSVGTKKAIGRNTIDAVVASDQSITNGQAVKLRTVEPMWVGNRFIPRNTTIVGMARLNGERLGVEITSVEVSGSIYEVELTVYDSDGQEGINIPNCLESDALKEIGANMSSTMGSSINLTTDVGAQLASDVGKGLINGVSQYLTKKIRTVKVHLKAGYRVMLYQPENN